MTTTIAPTSSHTAAQPQREPATERIPLHPSPRVLADLKRLEMPTRGPTAWNTFENGWEALTARLEDHGLPAPSRPWIYTDTKMQAAVKAAPSQPGFRPVAKSTVDAANELPLAMTRGGTAHVKAALAKLVKCVEEQSWAAPADVQRLAARLAQASSAPLEEQKALGLELKAAIDRYRVPEAPKKGGWFGN